jgi:hypothetical protein
MPCQPLIDVTGMSTIGPPCDDVNQSLVCLSDVCSRLPRVNEPCLDASLGRPPCDPDPALALACVGADFNGTGICERVGTLGSACGADGLAPCAVDLACIVDPTTSDLGICGPLPGAGETCDPGAPCAPPNVCAPDTLVCVPGGARHDGQPCLADNDCASISCVFSSSGAGTCGSPIDVTVACTGRGAAGAR